MKIHPCTLSLDFIELVRRALALLLYLCTTFNVASIYVVHAYSCRTYKRFVHIVFGWCVLSFVVGARRYCCCRRRRHHRCCRFLSIQMKRALSIPIKTITTHTHKMMISVGNHVFRLHESLHWIRHRCLPSVYVTICVHFLVRLEGIKLCVCDRESKREKTNERTSMTKRYPRRDHFWLFSYHPIVLVIFTK